MKNLNWTFALWICPVVYCSHLCTLRMHHLLHNQVSFWDLTAFFLVIFHALLVKSLSIPVHFCSSAQVMHISNWTTLSAAVLYPFCSLLFHSVFFICTDPLGYRSWPCWLLHCPQLVGLADYAPYLLLGVCPDNMMARWAVFLQMWLSKWIVPGKKVNFYSVTKNSLVCFGGWHEVLLLVRVGREVTVHVEVASNIQLGSRDLINPSLCTP